MEVVVGFAGGPQETHTGATHLDTTEWDHIALGNVSVINAQ